MCMPTAEGGASVGPMVCEARLEAIVDCGRDVCVCGGADGDGRSCRGDAGNEFTSGAMFPDC